MILLLENNKRGGLSSVMGDRYVKSDKNEKRYYMQMLINYTDTQCLNRYIP